METFAEALARERWREFQDIAVAPLFCTMIPRHVWSEVGELDDRFRVGMFEDDDFSVRIREHGYRIVSVEDCFIHHFGHGSFAKLSPAMAQQIFEENRAEFERKWQRRWVPHKTRPGVLPPGPQDRIKLDSFVRRA